MKPTYPDTLETAKLDLEINFEGRGGIQRFKTVENLRAWLAEERLFWKWLDQEPARSRRQQLGTSWEQFWRFEVNVQNELNRQSHRWSQLVNERAQLQNRVADESTSGQEKISAKDRIDSMDAEFESILTQVRNNLHSHIHTDVYLHRFHLLQNEPEAQFVAEIAATDLEAATFALDFFLLPNQQQNGEFRGRMLAAMFAENLNRKVRPDQKAFEKAIVTWAKELADFKARYELQESEFVEISQKHLDAEEVWRKRHDELAMDFGRMRDTAADELKALKDTYDSFMQLEAPREYWAKKRDEHGKGKKVMGWIAAIAAIFGAVVLSIAAWQLLPQNHPANTVPWRQIGFFFLASTFVLWLNRLLVRLMLSHIHLYADAREREVMISTFLALVHRQESREGLKKEDIALVLAPIFRPSTTGVIKDDGGPQSLSDLLSALTSGRGS